MKILRSLNEWRRLRTNLSPDIRLGFVPTMGNLHRGHLSLLKRSVKENDQTLLSIFVNPTQFDDPHDFKQYPQTLNTDFEMAESVGVDYVLIPTAADMYPDHYAYKIIETPLSWSWEGAYRPGHFTGMLTVVMKLLCLTQAHKTYFGEKDHQQLQLVKGLVNAFFLNTKIVNCKTVREESGLPLSSRNFHLNNAQRKLADKFAEIFHGTHSCESIYRQLIAIGIQVDYVEEHQQRRFAAVRIGKTRLIDNIEIPSM